MLALVLLAVFIGTGILLNHSKALKLEQHSITNEWLLDWYGLNPRGNPNSFLVGDESITQWGNKLFFNDHLLTETQDALVGAARSGKNILVVALTNSLLLLDADGELIEQTSPGFMPIKKIGSAGKLIVVEAQNGNHYRADRNIVAWQVADTTDITWSQSSALPMAIQQKIKRAWRGNNLTAEKILQDIHSGRIINASWGKFIIDTAALFLMLLGITAGWMWWSRQQ